MQIYCQQIERLIIAIYVFNDFSQKLRLACTRLRLHKIAAAAKNNYVRDEVKKKMCRSEKFIFVLSHNGYAFALVYPLEMRRTASVRGTLYVQC